MAFIEAGKRARYLLKDYLLHTLSPGAFEELVVKICHDILGVGVISFSSEPDGGRDAFLEAKSGRREGNER